MGRKSLAPVPTVTTRTDLDTDSDTNSNNTPTLSKWQAYASLFSQVSPKPLINSSFESLLQPPHYPILHKPPSATYKRRTDLDHEFELSPCYPLSLAQTVLGFGGLALNSRHGAVTRGGKVQLRNDCKSMPGETVLVLRFDVSTSGLGDMLVWAKQAAEREGVMRGLGWKTNIKALTRVRECREVAVVFDLWCLVEVCDATIERWDSGEMIGDEEGLGSADTTLVDDGSETVVEGERETNEEKTAAYWGDHEEGRIRFGYLDYAVRVEEAGG